MEHKITIKNLEKQLALALDQIKSLEKDKIELKLITVKYEEVMKQNLQLQDMVDKAISKPTNSTKTNTTTNTTNNYNLNILHIGSQEEIKDKWREIQTLENISKGPSKFAQDGVELFLMDDDNKPYVMLVDKSREKYMFRTKEGIQADYGLALIKDIFFRPGVTVVCDVIKELVNNFDILTDEQEFTLNQRINIASCLHETSPLYPKFTKMLGNYLSQKGIK